MQLSTRQNLLYKIRRYSKYPMISGVVVLLGFLREMTIAANYGLGAELDVFAIVLTLYIFFGTQIGNSFENVFIAEMAHKKTHEIARMLSVVLSIIGTVYIVILLIVYAFSSSYITLVYPALTQNQLLLADKMVPVFIVAIIAAVLAGVFKSNLYIKEKFTMGLFGGSFVSFFVIISVFIFSDTYGIMSLAYGYMVGSVVFMLVLFLFIQKTYLFKFKLSLQDIKTSGFFWKAFLLVIVGEILFQLTFTSQRSLASGLEEGAVSSLYYSMSIVSVVITLFIMPLSTVLFPKLKRQFNDDEVAGFAMLKKYLLYFFAFGSAAASVIYSLSEIIIKLAFVRGEFTIEDAQRTADLMSILVFLLPLMSVNMLIKYGYYSLKIYRAPTIGHLITWLVLIFTAPTFVNKYSESGLGYSIVLSVAVSSFILVTVLLWKSKHARM